MNIRVLPLLCGQTSADLPYICKAGTGGSARRHTVAFYLATIGTTLTLGTAPTWATEIRRPSPTPTLSPTPRTVEVRQTTPTPTVSPAPIRTAEIRQPAPSPSPSPTPAPAPTPTPTPAPPPPAPTPTPTPTPTTTTTTTPTGTVPCSPTGGTATNLVVCTASYLGGTSSDTAAGVEIAPDRSVVLAGTLIGNNLNRTPTYLQVPNGPVQGNGTVLRMDPTGRTPLSITRLGNTIDDLDIDRRTGNIVVAGDFGVAVLNPQATQILWTRNLGPGGGARASTGRRVAVGSGGQVATLFNKQVRVFDANGNLLGQFGPGGSYAEDVAIDSASGTVIVAGWSQRDGGGCSQLQIAHIRSFSYTGTLKWKNYDWSHAQAYGANSSCADTRGLRVAIGRDNLLYFAGESAGGNSIYRYNPTNLSAAAPNVRYDAYTDPYNTKSNHITYFARMVPATGQILAGQFLLSRLSAGGGNTINPRAITADERGTVYVGGASAASIANRNPVNLSINGQAIGPYSGGDGFLAIIAPDFRSRRIWTTWTGVNTTAAGSTITGVAAFQGAAATISTSNGNMITVNPLQTSNRGSSDIFFSVFPGR